MSDPIPPPETNRSHPSGVEEPTEVAGLRSPAAVNTTAAGQRLPTTIGPYGVVSVLGQGGMGVVFLAQQSEPIQRRLAVKLIRASHTTPEAQRRFEIERQILARMSHPHIAQVFDAGTTSHGEPWFAMEYVDGIAITDYCDQRRLGLDERLALFELVCEAVQHAHQKGIIHRDLKPSNILVHEEQGRHFPKLIDFGIAKALDTGGEAMTKLTGDRVIGTPAYLSPELLVSADWSNDPDTRSDVYALGVLLHELLVGTLPFADSTQNLLVTMRRKNEEEPPAVTAALARLEAAERERVATSRQLSPPVLARRLRGDLEWIVAKAMARERERRYGSVADLAEEIGRYRADLPVLAGPPSVGYRVRKLVRRHTAATIATVLVTAAGVGGYVARTLEADRANREAARANAEAAEARRTSGEATELARFMVGLFEAPEGGSEGRPLTADQLLAEGTARMRRELAEQPLTQARLLETVGTIYRKIGHYAEAEVALEESLATREGALGPDHLDTAASLAQVVTLYWVTGRFGEAEPLAEQALAIRESQLPPDHPDVAKSVESLALIYRRLGKIELAEPLLLRSLPNLERSVGPNHPEFATALNALGIHQWNQGRLEEAEGHLRRALALWEQVRGPDHPEVAATLNNLAGVARDRGDFASAEPLYQRALAIRRQAFGPEHPSLGYSYANLAQMRRKQGRLREAETLYRDALELWERVLGPDHPDVAFALNNLALTLVSANRAEQAEPLVARALAINLAALGSEHPSIASSTNIQALVAAALGRVDEAERLHKEALAHTEKVREAGHPSLAWPLQGLANLYRDHGRAAEAEPLYLRALQLRRASLGPNHPETRELVADYERWRRLTTARKPAPAAT